MPPSGVTQDVHPLITEGRHILTSPAFNPPGWTNGNGAVYSVPPYVPGTGDGSTGAPPPPAAAPSSPTQDAGASPSAPSA